MARRSAGAGNHGGRFVEIDCNAIARFCDLFLHYAQSAAHFANPAIGWCGAKADGTGGRFAVVGCSRFERTGVVFVTPFVNGRTHVQTALCGAGGPDAAAHGVGRACAFFRLAEACCGQFYTAMTIRTCCPARVSERPRFACDTVFRWYFLFKLVRPGQAHFLRQGPSALGLCVSENPFPELRGSKQRPIARRRIRPQQ